MKKIISTIFGLLIFLNLSFASTYLDSTGVDSNKIEENILKTEFENSEYLLQIINEYRNSKGLSSIELDTGLVNACKHQAIYMSFYDKAGHYQYKSKYINLQENISSPWDRAHHFSDLACKMVAENSMNAFGEHSGVAYSPELADQFQENRDYKSAAEIALKNWIWSKDHNKTLLKKRIKDEDNLELIAGAYQYVYYSKKDKCYRTAAVFLISYKNPYF